MCKIGHQLAYLLHDLRDLGQCVRWMYVRLFINHARPGALGTLPSSSREGAVGRRGGSFRDVRASPPTHVDILDRVYAGSAAGHEMSRNQAAGAGDLADLRRMLATMNERPSEMQALKEATNTRGVGGATVLHICVQGGRLEDIQVYLYQRFCSWART